MKLLPTSEYLNDASREIARSKKRVFVMTLCISRGPGIDNFIESLHEAAERGIDVHVAADTFTFSELGGIFNPLKQWMIKSQEAKTLVNKLRKSSAAFHWLGGNWHINPLAGVTHIKWTIVDDTVYCFGGVNLYDRSVNNIDYMFKVRDKKLADTLVNEHQEIVQDSKKTTDYKGTRKDFDIGKLLIDSGHTGDSIIYDRAVELARQAQSILFVSQYCPTGELAEIMKAKKANIYFNQPKNTHIWTNIMLRYSMRATGLKSQYKNQKYLHGKFIIFTMPDGSKVALTGSHNFSYSGVRLGTREVGLETTDEKLISLLEDFYKKFIT